MEIEKEEEDVKEKNKKESDVNKIKEEKEENKEIKKVKDEHLKNEENKKSEEQIKKQVSLKEEGFKYTAYNLILKFLNEEMDL